MRGAERVDRKIGQATQAAARTRVVFSSQVKPQVRAARLTAFAGRADGDRRVADPSVASDRRSGARPLCSHRLQLIWVDLPFAAEVRGEDPVRPLSIAY